MDFRHSAKSTALQERLQAFMDEHVYPNESVYKAEQAAMPDRWRPVPVVERLKPLARAAGLWNLFLPASASGAGLTNLEYAPLAEDHGPRPVVLGSVQLLRARTGNMETLERYGTPAQKAQWLEPAARGRNPLVLRDDRARGRLLGRHKHRLHH